MQHAAASERERGAPGDALKLFQLAQARLLGAPDDQPRLPKLQLWLHALSAHAYALLDRPDHVRRELRRAKEYPTLEDPFERADMDDVRASIELLLDRVEVAEQYAAVSVRTWAPGERRDSAMARITLATTHALSGEPDAPRLAARALPVVQRTLTVRNRVEIAAWARRTGIVTGVTPESVLDGFGDELRWCLQVVGAEQDGVLDAHGLAAHRGEHRDEVPGGGVVRERSQVRGVRLERGDAAA